MPAPKRYDRYQYETSPRKIAPSQIPKKKPKAPKKPSTKTKPTKEELRAVKKAEAQKKAKLVFYLCMGFVILFTIGYRNSQINENFSKKQALEKQISMLKKENEQLEVSIQNNQNLNQLEQAAKERLGMQKLTNKQTVYIDLPKKDYVEAGAEKVIIEEEQEGILERILNKIQNIFK